MNKLKKIIGITLIASSLFLVSCNNSIHKTTITDDSIRTLQDSTGQQIMTIYADAVELENVNSYNCINNGNLHVELTKDNEYIQVEYTEKTIEIISNTNIEIVKNN